MKIAIDADVLGRGRRPGDERYMANLIRELARIDERNAYTLLVGPDCPSSLVASIVGANRRFRARPVGPVSPWVRFPLALPLALRRSRHDLLHVQYFLPPGSPRRSVVTIHDISFVLHPELFRPVERFVLSRLVPASARRATAVITDSERSRRDMIDRWGLSPSKISAIPLATAPAFRPTEGTGASASVRDRFGLPERFVLYTGSLQPRKNVAGLIRAFARARSEAAEGVSLVIAGKKKYKCRDLESAIASTGLGDRVILTGPVPDDDLPALYGAAELFVFPSLYEGFGLPPLEAMACGTPVVSSHAGSLGEVVGDAALTVDPRDEGAMAAAIVKVLTEPGLGESLRTRGLEQAARFTWERTARETLKLYETVGDDVR